MTGAGRKIGGILIKMEPSERQIQNASFSIPPLTESPNLKCPDIILSSNKGKGQVTATDASRY